MAGAVDDSTINIVVVIILFFLLLLYITYSIVCYNRCYFVLGLAAFGLKALFVN